MKTIECDMCTSQMSLTKTMKSKKGYKVRRYKCSICDFEKSIFGAGYYDEGDGHNAQIRQDVNKMYKQQEMNNL